MSIESSKQGTPAFAEESVMDKTVDTLPETRANDNASLATAPPSDGQPKASMPVSEDGDWGPKEAPLTAPPSDGHPKASMPVSEDRDQGPQVIPLTAPPSDGQPKALMSVSEDRDQGPEAIPLTVPHSDEPEMTAAAAQNLEMGDFWNDPVFETPLMNLDNLSGDSNPSPIALHPPYQCVTDETVPSTSESGATWFCCFW